MAEPMQIIITTNDDRFIYTNVLEILIRPTEGGLEIRQDSQGWALVPRERAKNEKEEIPLEQAEMRRKHAEPRFMRFRGLLDRLDHLHLDHDGIGRQV